MSSTYVIKSVIRKRVAKFISVSRNVVHLKDRTILIIIIIIKIMIIIIIKL